jgi:hypothetical protein
MPLRLRKVVGALPNALPLAVRTDRSSYRPGEAIEIVVAAGPAQKDIVVSELRVSLEHRITYEYDSWNGRTYVTRTRTDRTTADEARFTLQGAIAAGETPELARGRIIDSTWRLEATIGVPGSVDASADAPIRVYAPRDRHAGRTTHPPEDGTGGKAAIELRVDDPHARLGGRLTGTVAIRGIESVEVEGIRVELVAHEHVRVSDEKHSWSVDPRQELAGATALSPGDVLSFAFALDVPQDVPASLHAPEGSIVWSVRAVLDRKRRGDLHLAHEVNVYDEPPPGVIEPGGVESGLFARRPGEGSETT